MMIQQEIKAFTAEILRIRQLIQEGRRLTLPEHQTLKSHLESLLLDLDRNIREDAKQK